MHRRILSACFILFLFFFPFLLKAQDTLVMNDGSEMYVKVVEVGENTISYKKRDNLSGPVYTTGLSKVFMAFYKGGKRENFLPINNSIASGLPEQKPGKDSIKTLASLSDGNFEVRLIKAEDIPDKNRKAITVNASVDVKYNAAPFCQLSLVAYQRTDIALDFNNLNGGYLNKSNIVISAPPKFANILWEKYENYQGQGFAWALPPKFFSTEPASCYVAFLEQKSGNKELLGFGGISSSKYPLTDCSSIENKLLSIALLWLEKNFSKK